MHNGAMDVNAVYFGDDDLSGASAALKGPLNMNGAGSTYEGDAVQWDGAIKLSDPGLGRAGTDKATYVSEGETLTVELDIDSLDDIDFFGIRATSPPTDAGSIKAVSGDPEEPEDPGDPEDPVDATYDKVFFDVTDPQPGGSIVADAFITAEQPTPYFGNPVLPADTEPTFENYVAYHETLGYGEVSELQSVVFCQNDEEGVPQEVLRVNAPEGGFADAAELLDAYDETIAAQESDEAASFELMSLLSFESDPEDAVFEDEQDEPEEIEVL